jgi:hypothetical protein
MVGKKGFAFDADGIRRVGEATLRSEQQLGGPEIPGGATYHRRPRGWKWALITANLGNGLYNAIEVKWNATTFSWIIIVDGRVWTGTNVIQEANSNDTISADDNVVVPVSPVGRTDTIERPRWMFQYCCAGGSDPISSQPGGGGGPCSGFDGTRTLEYGGVIYIDKSTDPPLLKQEKITLSEEWENGTLCESSESQETKIIAEWCCDVPSDGGISDTPQGSDEVSDAGCQEICVSESEDQVNGSYLYNDDPVDPFWIKLDGDFLILFDKDSGQWEIQDLAGDEFYFNEGPEDTCPPLTGWDFSILNNPGGIVPTLTTGRCDPCDPVCASGFEHDDHTDSEINVTYDHSADHAVDDAEDGVWFSDNLPSPSKFSIFYSISQAEWVLQKQTFPEAVIFSNPAGNDDCPPETGWVLASGVGTAGELSLGGCPCEFACVDGNGWSIWDIDGSYELSVDEVIGGDTIAQSWKLLIGTDAFYLWFDETDKLTWVLTNSDGEFIYQGDTATGLCPSVAGTWTFIGNLAGGAGGTSSSDPTVTEGKCDAWFLKFEEASGNPLVDQFANKGAQITDGGVTRVSAYEGNGLKMPAGFVSQAFQADFDGFLITGDFDLSFRFKCDTVAPGTAPRLLEVPSLLMRLNLHGGNISEPNKGHVDLGGFNAPSILSAGRIDDGVFHKLQITRVGTTYTFLIDDVSQGSGAGTVFSINGVGFGRFTHQTNSVYDEVKWKA